MAQGIFRREELLLGADMMEVIASKRVIIFGVGGVGSWCAESLVSDKHQSPTYGNNENGG